VRSKEERGPYAPGSVLLPTVCRRAGATAGLSPPSLEAIALAPAASRFCAARSRALLELIHWRQCAFPLHALARSIPSKQLIKRPPIRRSGVGPTLDLGLLPNAAQTQVQMALDERNFGGLRFAAIYTVGRSSVFAGTPSARFLLAREWCEGEVRCRELPGVRSHLFARQMVGALFSTGAGFVSFFASLYPPIRIELYPSEFNWRTARLGRVVLGVPLLVNPPRAP